MSAFDGRALLLLLALVAFAVWVANGLNKASRTIDDDLRTLNPDEPVPYLVMPELIIECGACGETVCVTRDVVEGAFFENAHRQMRHGATV